jgi:5,10-methylenetetrahydromethanopterin reductase
LKVDRQEIAQRLGCSVLPGGVTDPSSGIHEVRTAEAIGLGTVWIGERYDTKDLGSLAGAFSQVTERVQIGSAVTHSGIRHPMALASMGQTLQSLTKGRFLLGLGRSASWRWRMYGVRPPTTQALRDIASILSRLWAGETVRYQGPLGEFPELRLAQRIEIAPPPLLLAAVGPKTLQLAGEAYDGVILHPFLTPEAVAKSVRTVRDAADRAGRDPDAIRCCAAIVVAPDRTPEGQALAVNARAAGYFQVGGLGDALVEANGWDVGDLARYRAQPVLTELGNRPADKVLTRDELIALTSGMPGSWLPSSSAVGTAQECARRLKEYLDAGADELLLHGSTAEHLGSLVEAFAQKDGS